MINANFEVELDIANILKAFSNLENQVEKLKINILENPNFDIYEVYSLINRDSKPSITVDDIVRFLSLNHIPTSHEEIFALIEFSFNRKLKTLIFEYFTKLIFPKTNASLKEQILKRNTKDDNTKPFKYYALVSEFSEKQTASILEKELSILHELRLLQNYLIVNYPNISSEDIYTILKRKSKQKRIDYDCLEAFFKSLGIQYSEEEFSALMRRINAEDTSHLSRFDIVKIFLPEKIGRIPPNLTKVSAQRKINKDCFSSFNDHIIRIEQNAGLKKKIGKKFAKDEPTENDFWKQIKKSRSIFRNKIELYNDDNFHHYLPLDSIRKEIDLRKESLKSLISHRKFDQMEEIKKPFCIFVDYYKQYTNN